MPPTPQRRSSSRANRRVAPNRLGSWPTRAGSRPDLTAISAERATTSSGCSDETSSAGAQSAHSIAEKMEGIVGGLSSSRIMDEMAKAASLAATSSSYTASVSGRSSSSRHKPIADLNALLLTNILERNQIRQSRMQVESAFAENKMQLMMVHGATVNASPTTTSGVQTYAAISASHPLQKMHHTTTTAMPASSSTSKADTPSEQSSHLNAVSTMHQLPTTAATVGVPFGNKHPAAPQSNAQPVQAPKTVIVHSPTNDAYSTLRTHQVITPVPHQTQHAHPAVFTHQVKPALQQWQHAYPSAHGLLAARTNASMCSQYTTKTTPALSYMHAGIQSLSSQPTTHMARQPSSTSKSPQRDQQAHLGPLDASRAALVAHKQDTNHRALPAAQMQQSSASPAPLSSHATSSASFGVPPATAFAQSPLQHVAYAQQAAATAPTISAAGFVPYIGAFGARVNDAIGASSFSAFAPPTNAFGAQSFSAFGAQSSGAFVEPPPSVFCAPTLSAHGAYVPNAGAPSHSAFGGFNAAASHHFGAVDAQTLGAHGVRNPGAMGYGEVALHPHRRLYELPPFSGRPEEWPMFVNTFVNTTAAYGYTQLENLTRLQKSVVGEAKQTIQCLLIHPQHVDAAMMRLQSLYGRPERLVRSQIQLVRDLPAVTEERIVELVPFATVVQNVAMFLDTPATQFYLADPILLEELVRKLPMCRRISWAADAARLGRQATVMDFANWVTVIADLIGNVAYEVDCTQLSRPESMGGEKQHVLLNVLSDASAKKCAFCSGKHSIVRCVEFLKLAIDDRRRAVFKRTLCIGCFDASHILPGCEKRQPCGEGGCTSGHHRLLHAKKVASANTSANFDGCRRQRRKQRRRRTRTAERTKAAPSKTSPTAHAANSLPLSSSLPVARKPDESAVVSTASGYSELMRRSVMLYRIVPVTVHGPKGQVATFAMLDEGSSTSLVDACMADELGLQGSSSELRLSWFSDHTSVTQSRRVTLDIAGMQEGCERYSLQDVRTIEKLELPTQTVDAQSLLEQFPHLKNVPFFDYADAKPRVLIGLNHHQLGVPTEIRADAEQRGIVASNTPLGWIVYGSDGPTPLLRANVLTIREATYAENQYDSRGPAWPCLSEEERSRSSPTREDDLEARRNFVGAVRKSRPIFIYDRHCDLLYPQCVTAHMRYSTETSRTKTADDLERPPDTGDIRPPVQETVNGREAVGERSEWQRLNACLKAGGQACVYGRMDEANDQNQTFDSRRRGVWPLQHRFKRYQKEKNANQRVIATIDGVRRSAWEPPAVTLISIVHAKRAVSNLRNAIPTHHITDACFVCCRYLCHVRGTHGPNFRCARKVLAKEEEILDAAVMQRELCTTGIQWVVNCPGIPEAGVVWSRIDEGVKRKLSRRLGQQWQDENLTAQTRRSKNQPKRYELADVVDDSNQPGERWPISRIVSIGREKDGSALRRNTGESMDGGAVGVVEF